MEVDNISRLVDTIRLKFMAEFEKWYDDFAEAHGGEVKEDHAEVGCRENACIHNVQDVMDIGEKFDKLQLERMSKEDPDSYAFYNARKKTERKIRSKKY